MKRTFTLVIILLFALTWSEISGQIYLVNEGFESSSVPPSDWVYAIGVTHPTTRPRTGLRSVRFGSNDHSIRTPVLTTPEILSFWLYRNPGGNLNVQVQWATDPNAAVWNTVANIQGTNNTWIQYTTNISTNSLFTTKTNIYIRIRSNSGTRVFFVDDFSVTSTAPIPNFSAVPTTAATGESITFTDLSQGTISSWLWDFGTDASPSTANTSGPHIVTYSTPGYKTISLALNGSFNETKPDYISITSPVESSSATFSSGDISTDFGFQTLPGQSTCPGALSVYIPIGAVIDSISVTYRMTGLNYGWLSEQRSQLRCISAGGLSETTLSQTSGNIEGSFVYTRSGLNIANGVAGGGNILFELHAGRTWGGTGCNATYNKVDNNTWTVTVFYHQVPFVDFTANTLSAEINQTITFTDNSGGGSFSSWNWDFGAGAVPSSAAGQGPHNVAYTTAGNKTVSLTIDGTFTETKANYITITEPSDWLHWDDGSNFTGAGRTTAGILQIAARFEPSDLLAYPSHEITKVRTYIDDLPISASVKIWQGINQAGLVEYVSQSFTPISNSWVEIILTEPFEVDPLQELWFGIEYQDPGAGIFPAGLDEFTESDGKSNLYRLNNNDNLSWAPLSGLATPIPGDWNVQAWLVEFTPVNPFNPPRFLSATVENGNDVLLNWYSPAIDEGFELYTSFDLSFGNWTQYDFDEDVTWGSAAYDFPNENYTGSFIIFKPSATTPPAADPNWQPYSGQQFAACISANPGPNDDWLITPQLRIAAGDQLSFYHRSVVVTYGLERFKVGISTTGTNPADFTFITPSPYLESPASWTQFSYDLSAYTNQKIYIAINCVSNDAFVFMLDNFVISDAKGDLKLSMTFDEKNNPGVMSPENLLKNQGNASQDLIVPFKSTKLFANYKIYRNNVEIDQVTDFTYTDQNLAPGTYYYYVTAVYADPFGESDSSNVVEVEIGENWIWTGAISSAWTNANNWNRLTVPGAGSTVLIPVTANDPEISSAISVLNLSIETGAMVTVNPDGSLTIGGTIVNSSGVSGLIIQSSSSGTGSLISETSNVEATFQRYIKGEPEAWHMLSSPVFNQTISGDFTPSGTYGDGTGYDFYAWYEQDTSWVYLLNTEFPPTWNDVNGSNNFNLGKGYLVSYQDANPTLHFEGVLNTGNINISITNSALTGDPFGANLIGNPYPSSIDWKAAAGWGRSDLEQSSGGYDIWIWNDVAYNYGVFNSASANDEGTLGVSRFIAPNQGFFVLAGQSGAITMNNNIRTHQGSDNWLKSTKQFTDIVFLTVESDDNLGTDEIMIGLEKDIATGGTPKRFSFVTEAPSLFIPKNGQFYSAISGNNADKNPVVPISFIPGKNGNYSMTAIFENDFFQMALLHDKAAGIKHDFKLNPRYDFTADSDDNAARFILQFTPGDFGDPHEELPARIYAYDGVIYIDLRMIDSDINFELIDLTGCLIVQTTLQGGKDYQLELHLSHGVYISRLNGNLGTISKKIVF